MMISLKVADEISRNITLFQVLIRSLLRLDIVLISRCRGADVIITLYIR